MSSNSAPETSEKNLRQHIIQLIRETGPIPISAYMALALSHPTQGYYTSNQPIGRSGDFITAPEISQIFGELIGIWCLQAWMEMGSPNPVHLVELGPGRGTLMNDVLRIAQLDSKFAKTLQIHLVEISPTLRQAQESVLSEYSQNLNFHQSLETLPVGSKIILANEFFDALPIRQFQRQGKNWHERLVGLSEGNLAFGLSQEPVSQALIPTEVADAQENEIIELPIVADQNILALCETLKENRSTALIIDYGYAKTQTGNTFQAIKSHEYVDPLEQPGQADLTSHINFDRIAEQARAQNITPHKLITQQDFLTQMGINERMEQLCSANLSASQTIKQDVARLTQPDQMGTLFKVLMLSSHGLATYPFVRLG